VKEITQEWVNRPICGRFYRDLSDKNVDQQDSTKWLQQGNLYCEMEAFMTGIQDGILPTRSYQKYVLRTPNVKDECRKCGEKGETIERITGGCKTKANEYLVRHNNVSKIIHQKLAYRHKVNK
jgi:hypothetical protein